MNSTAIIEKLGLRPHPEGGFFRETYRCNESVDGAALASRYGGGRSVSTAIYFLLTGETFSAFHRLRSDEIWHFYSGDPAELHVLYPDGRHEQHVVGPDLSAGQFPQVVIPRGCWFAARVPRADGYILLGCTVAPGFDFSDFELARRDELIHLFPQHTSLITSFTR
jgi:predicted cupin superfamily sugar epimerase